MISPVTIPGFLQALRSALGAAGLPTDDLDDPGRSFFSLEGDGQPVGFAGIELYGADVLLRSVVVLPEQRGKGFGRAVVEGVLSHAHQAGARRAWLFTDSAEPFFAREGFARIERAEAPSSILATRQATTICATASLLMRRIVPHD